MLALQIIAAILLFLSAALFFGPQLVIYGPRAFPNLVHQPQARFIGGFLTTATVFVLTAPHMGSALITGSEAVTFAARELVNLSFSLV